MNKKDLAEKVAAVTGGTKVEGEKVVEVLFDTITNALKSRESVAVPGFGKFEAAYRKASTKRNPRTGEPVQVPEHHAPKFRPAKALKEAVR